MKIAVAFQIPLAVVICFWAILGVEHATNVELSFLGVYPRTLNGLAGILFAPFLHGSFNHLVSNSAVFIILAGSTLYFFPKTGVSIFLTIYLLTGIGVWCFARPAYHIGASGLIYGFGAHLFFSGIFRKELKFLILSLLIAIFYNSMLYGLFPTDPHISWESHLIGFIVGAITSFYFRNHEFEINESSKTDIDTDDKSGYRNIENEHITYVFKAERRKS